MADQNQHAGGEEWRSMDTGKAIYNPDDYADILGEAKRRIPSVRQSPVRLRVVNRQGQPYQSTKLTIEQTKNAFPFGEQVWGLDAMIRDGQGESEKAKATKRLLAELYNAINNLCYWTERPRHDASKTEERQGEWNIENFAHTVDWTLSQGMLAKGHPLFWSCPKAVPDWVKAYDAETRMKFAEVRVRNIVSRFKGKVKIWDAVNEPMWEPTLANVNKREWPHIEKISDIADSLEPVLRWCREEDPSATYIINDYGVEDPPGKGNIHRGNDGSEVSAASQRKRLLALFRELERRGVPADAVGLQSHTGWTDHREQWDLYDEIGEAGWPVHITEFWVSTGQMEKSGELSQKTIDALVAEYVANVLTCAYAHPHVEAFFAWGLFGKAVRFGEYSSHEKLPLFHRMKQLFTEEWMTREELTTNDDGVVEFSGFHGDYNVIKTLAGGVSAGRPFTVQKGAQNVFEIVLP